MQHTHRVKRTFPSSQSLKVGSPVDASGWRNRAMLERQGYIEPIERETAAVVETTAIEPIEVPQADVTETTIAPISELLNIVAPAEERPSEVVEATAAASTPAEAPATTTPAEATISANTSSKKKSTAKTKK